MTNDSGSSKRPWEEKMSEAGARIEEEVRRVVRFIDDEVVPDVRRSSSVALRSAAERLAELAKRLDDKLMRMTPTVARSRVSAAGPWDLIAHRHAAPVRGFTFARRARRNSRGGSGFLLVPDGDRMW